MAKARILAFPDIVKIRAPFRTMFVAALTAGVPVGEQWWDAAEGAWVTFPKHLKFVISIARRVYAEVIVDEFEDEAEPPRREEAREAPKRTAAGNSQFYNAYDGKCADSGKAWSDLRTFLNADDLKSLYHLLAKRHHPDAGGDGARMAELNRLFEVLGVKK